MTVTPTKTDRLDELHRRLSAHVLGLISGADWQAMLNWYRSVFEASEWVTGSMGRHPCTILNGRRSEPQCTVRRR